MKISEDTTLRFVTLIDEQVAGPYTLEGLHSLVYLGRITPDTLISREDEDAFLPIRATVLRSELFPLLNTSAPPQQWAPPGETARVDRKHYELGEAKFQKVNDTRPRRARIEVKEILDEVRQAEIAAGLDLPGRHRFRISRRSIDFWIMLIAGNVVIIGGGIAMQNTASIVFGFAGSGLYTFGLLWSMYGVMDRY
jgi:hypothetical protein